MSHRTTAAALGAAATVMVLSTPALATQHAARPATIDPPNSIGCSGSATITDGATTSTVDAKDAQVTVPRSGTVAYTGGTTKAVHHVSGTVTVDLGVASPSYSWSGANDSSQTTKQGTRDLPSALKLIPPGTYTVTVTHSGDEGSCSASVRVKVEGGLLSTPAGVVSVVGTLLSLGVLGALGKAAFAGKVL